MKRMSLTNLQTLLRFRASSLTDHVLLEMCEASGISFLVQTEKDFNDMPDLIVNAPLNRSETNKKNIITPPFV